MSEGHTKLALNTRSYKKFNKVAFLKDLEIILWSCIEAFDDVNDIWGIWKDLILGVCDKHAQHTKIRVRGEKTEWLTDEYIGMTYESDDLK